MKTENSSPYFSIVIPAYNEEEHIGSCLRSIFESNYDSTGYEVIVVDNGSQDRTREIALNHPQVRFFELPEGNVGAVRNYGAARARGDILVFIDADCLLDKDWLNRAEQLIKDKPNCAYGGGAKLPSNASWIETSWLLENNGKPTLPKHLIGACTMLLRNLFSEVMGFNELISSGEDTDLHNRLVPKNIPVIICHELDVTHLGNAKNISQFIKRQIWHSENYIRNITKSIKDPIFLITLAFISLSALTTIQFLISPNIILTATSFIIFLCTPAILSFKRLLRSGKKIRNPYELLSIYIIDFLYITGRSLGIFRELLLLLKYKYIKD
ncbi:glycosyltransferase [Marinobacter sp. F3R11]|uniref:glycosyltransferase n=1 Tax=Marinobacter sp. F3R11 TaxID=2267231 RepID=UPI001651879F|nr:glycosyltransferase [Marinobacter sp. F3R11]